MISHSTWAFGLKLAAGFNWIAALVMFASPGALIADTDMHFLFRVIAMFVAVFGYMYWQAGSDFSRTDYIWFGLICKVVGVGIIWSHTFFDMGSRNLSILAIGDLPFIVIFLLFLRCKPGDGGRESRTQSRGN